MTINTKISRFGKALVCAAMFCAASGASALDLRPEDAPAKCGSHKPQVQAVVHGVSAQGILTVELYRPSKNDFLRKASRVKRVRVAAAKGPQTVCFNVSKPGTYALAAYHDVNANRKLDRKITQLPKEPFALSNNRPLGLRFPKFEEAAFNVPASGAKIDLKLETR